MKGMQQHARTSSISGVSRGALAVLGAGMLAASALLTVWPQIDAPRKADAATTTVTVGQTNGGGAIGVNQYNAASLSIVEGDTVTWNSAADAKFHDVTSYDESSPGTPAWSSPMLKSGTADSSFSRVFSTAGTYTYWCSLHASRDEADPAVVDANIAAGKMVGKVSVAAAATATATNTPTPSDTPPPGSTSTNTPTATVPPTQTNTPTASSTATKTSTPTRTATPLPNTITVEMKNFEFDPKNVTIRVGDTIRWVNNSGTPHTSTSSGNWDSDIVNNGGSYQRTFNTAGTFNYKCDIHPTQQTGTITVEAAAGTPTATTSAVATATAAAATPTPPVAAVASGGLTQSTGGASGPRAARAAVTVDVAMQDYLFSPGTITVAVGDSIRWLNQGQAPHNTTADGGAWASKQLMNSGETFSFKFTTAGTFTYKCTLHAGQGQKGTVVVKPVAEGTLLPDAGTGEDGSGRVIRLLLATTLALGGFCAVSASLWTRRAD